jgi:putative acetyltransferase
MQIEPERSGDTSAIRLLTRAAFKGMPFSRRTEAQIVDALRAAGALTISLVAIVEDEVVGHAGFSPVSIDGVKGDWYGLGPVSVSPERQGRGTGQALIRDGLERLRSIDADGCVVLGAPAYYGRFGFESDPALVYGDVAPGYFQRLIFKGPAPKGKVAFHPSFDAT